MRGALVVVWLMAGCRPADPVEPEGYVFPEPGAAPALRGGGGPAVSFAADQLFVACATLDGGAGVSEDDGEAWEDGDYHNLVMPYRGHLVLPWAAEWGHGGLSFFDVSDPCAPALVGTTYDSSMRETHAIGFVHLPEDDPHAGDWAVVNAQKGVLFWDIRDPAAPVAAGSLELPDVFWPDAYARVVLSVAWQYPWLYVAAADNGVFVIDATDPTAPELLAQVSVGLRAGGVFVLGDRLFVTSAEQTSAAVLDISTPDDPQLVPGGLFETATGDGEVVETYHGNMAGDYAIFARKEGGGGFLVYDLAPVDQGAAPAFLGEVSTGNGNGGYVFWDEGHVFLGNTDLGYIYDATDISTPSLVGTADLDGDLDTVIPYGNVAVFSVDDDAEPDRASVIVPWAAEPDVTGPTVLRLDPLDGEHGVAVTSRVGIGFDEPVEPSTVFPGSIRLYDEDGAPVEGWGSAQENTAHYSPKAPLKPGTTYTLQVMAGGVTDLDGNPVAETLSATFTTAGAR